jgi:hypothetical protein
MDAQNPTQVARNMVATRGITAALERCDRYISGAVRSENPREFWEAVKASAEVYR